MAESRDDSAADAGSTVAKPTPDNRRAERVNGSAGAGAIVTAARVGRLFGRSGWRIARQIPGINLVEQQAQRLRQLAAVEVLRLLEIPQQLFTGATSEESRVMMLVHNSGDDPEPLRSAMTELLQRSSARDATGGRDYLYGSIVSQLVPDEARILAKLSGGEPFAAVDVVAKQLGRSSARTVLANVSSVGRAAGLATQERGPTYLSRLAQFGLIEFGPASEELVSQYDMLTRDDAVRAARTDIDKNRLGSARIVRRTVQLSSFGKEFWAACAPARATIERRYT
ncbi:Abi-alpha family protein [uncultured Jatrophihabitans sp.]|uniref:Abi-alpha family protein n=1 Tax=uncultured Jatrophihabitans sp. TaxID=1610747 RepID=UPI0035CBBAE7